jgi:hypothetical protein
MKKNYITPEIKVIQLEALCNGDIVTASVFKGSTKGECIGNFGVVNEDATKTDTKYEGLWGESNSNNWGDD